MSDFDSKLESKSKSTRLNNNWFMNVGKSLGMSAGEIMSDLAPSPIEFITSNAEHMQSIYQDFKDKKVGQTRLSSFLNLDSQMQLGKDALKNTIDDIKSGKIYNKDRVDSLYADDFDLGDDFNMDFGDDESQTKSVIINNNKDVVSAIAGQTETIAKTTEASIKVSEAMHTNNIVFNTKNIDKLVSGMDAINQNISLMVKFQGDSMAKYIAASMSYYEEQSKFISKSMSDIDNYKKDEDKKRSRQQQNPWDDVLLANGGLSIEGYFSNIKKNFETASADDIIVSTVMNFLNDEDTLKHIVASPLSFVATSMAKTLIPTMFKQTMESFNRTFESFAGAMLMKVNKMGDTSNPFIELVSKLLGVNVKTKTSIDTDGYYKGDMQYNGLANKAITEVIPTYLRKILATLSGKQEMVFDYNRGSFTDFKSIKDRFEADKKSVSTKAYSEYIGKLNKSLEAFAFEDENDKVKFKDEMREFFYALGNNGNLVNPKLRKDSEGNTVDELAQTYSFSSSDKQDLFRSLIEETLSESELMELFGQLTIQARQDINRFYSREEATANGRGSELYNNNKANSHIQIKDNGEIILNDSLFNIKDVYGHDELFYLRNITSILSRGIVTYSSNGIGANSPAFNPNSSVLSKFSDEVSSSNDRAIRRTENRLRRNEYDVTQRAKLVEHGRTLINGTSDLESIDETRAQVRTYLDTNDTSANSRQEDSFGKKLLSYLPESMQEAGNRLYNSLTKLVETPAELANSAVKKIEHAMFSMVFGMDDVDGEEDKSIFGKILNRITLGVTSMMDMVRIKVIDPLSETLFGDDGIFTKIKNSADWMYIKDGAKNIWGKLFGSGEGDDAKEGIFSGVGKVFSDSAKAVRHEFTGKEYTDSNGNTISRNDNNVLSHTKKFGKDFADSISIHLTGKTTSDLKDDIMNKSGDPDNSLIHKVNTSLTTGVKTLGDALFGNGTFDKYNQQEFNDEFKKKVPKYIAAGLVGGIGGSLLLSNTGLLGSLFLPGGPIGGAMLGVGAAMISQSETMKDMIFGPKGADGSRIGGIISASTQKFLTANKTLMIGTGALGAMKNIMGIGILPSFMMPGGPIGGALFGISAGLLYKASGLNKLLFGKENSDGTKQAGLINGAFAKLNKNNALGNGAVGAIGGAGLATIVGQMGIMGSMLTPFGPLGGAIMGAATGILASSDRWKTMLFGQMDESTGKRHGGLFGGMKSWLNLQVMEPMKYFFDDIKTGMQHWFEKSIAIPFKFAMQPITSFAKNVFKGARDMIADGFTLFTDFLGSAFTKYIAKPIGTVFKNFIFKPIKKLASMMFKSALGIAKFAAAMPMKFVSLAGDMAHGANRMSARRGMNVERDNMWDRIHEGEASFNDRDTVKQLFEFYLSKEHRQKIYDDYGASNSLYSHIYKRQEAYGEQNKKYAEEKKRLRQRKDKVDFFNKIGDRSGQLITDASGLQMSLDRIAKALDNKEMSDEKRDKLYEMFSQNNINGSDMYGEDGELRTLNMSLAQRRNLRKMIQSGQLNEFALENDRESHMKRMDEVNVKGFASLLESMDKNMGQPMEKVVQEANITNDLLRNVLAYMAESNSSLITKSVKDMSIDDKVKMYEEVRNHARDTNFNMNTSDYFMAAKGKFGNGTTSETAFGTVSGGEHSEEYFKNREAKLNEPTPEDEYQERMAKLERRKKRDRARKFRRRFNLGMFASGLDSAPFTADAFLHKGEMVLPTDQSEFDMMFGEMSPSSEEKYATWNDTKAEKLKSAIGREREKFNLGIHSSGLDVVPYDNYKATLHKGEAVIPANQSNFIRDEYGLDIEDMSNATGPMGEENALVNAIPKYTDKMDILNSILREVYITRATVGSIRDILGYVGFNISEMTTGFTDFVDTEYYDEEDSEEVVDDNILALSDSVEQLALETRNAVLMLPAPQTALVPSSLQTPELVSALGEVNDDDREKDIDAEEKQEEEKTFESEMNKKIAHNKRKTASFVQTENLQNDFFMHQAEMNQRQTDLLGAISQSVGSTAGIMEWGLSKDGIISTLLLLGLPMILKWLRKLFGKDDPSRMDGNGNYIEDIDAREAITRAITKAMGYLSKALLKAIPKITDWLDDLARLGTRVIDDILKPLMKSFGQVFDDIAKVFKYVGDDVARLASKMGRFGIEALDTMDAKLSKVMGQMVDDVKRFFGFKSSGAGDNVINKVIKESDGVTKVLVKNGDSVIAKTVGKNGKVYNSMQIGSGVDDTLKKTFPQLTGEVDAMFNPKYAGHTIIDIGPDGFKVGDITDLTTGASNKFPPSGAKPPRPNPSLPRYPNKLLGSGTAGEVAENATIALGSGGDDLIKGAMSAADQKMAQQSIKLGEKVITEYVTGVGNAIPTKGAKGAIGKVLGTALSAFKKISPKAIAKALGKISMLGLEAAARIFSTPVLMTYGAAKGLFEAARLFKIHQPEVTITMSLISMAFESMLNFAWLFIIDIINELIIAFTGVDIFQIIATAFYAALPGTDGEDLTNAQNKFSADVKRYNDMHGTSLDENSFNDLMNQTFLDKFSFDGRMGETSKQALGQLGYRFTKGMLTNPQAIKNSISVAGEMSAKYATKTMTNTTKSMLSGVKIPTGKAAKEASEAAMKAAVSEADDKIIKGFTKNVDKGLQLIENAFCKVFKKSASKISGMTKKIVSKMVPSVVKKFIPKITAKGAGMVLGGMTAGLWSIGEGIYGAIVGATDPGTLFGVPNDRVDWKMKTISGVFESFLHVSWFFVIDIANDIFREVSNIDLISELAIMVYKIVADDEEEQELEALQVGALERMNEYNLQNSTNLSISQYLDKEENHTWWDGFKEKAGKFLFGDNGEVDGPEELKYVDKQGRNVILDNSGKGEKTRIDITQKETVANMDNVNAMFNEHNNIKKFKDTSTITTHSGRGINEMRKIYAASEGGFNATTAEELKDVLKITDEELQAVKSAIETTMYGINDITAERLAPVLGITAEEVQGVYATVEATVKGLNSETLEKMGPITNLAQEELTVINKIMESALTDGGAAVSEAAESAFRAKKISQEDLDSINTIMTATLQGMDEETLKKIGPLLGISEANMQHISDIFGATYLSMNKDMDIISTVTGVTFKKLSEDVLDKLAPLVGENNEALEFVRGVVKATNDGMSLDQLIHEAKLKDINGEGLALIAEIFNGTHNQLNEESAKKLAIMLGVTDEQLAEFSGIVTTSAEDSKVAANDNLKDLAKDVGTNTADLEKGILKSISDVGTKVGGFFDNVGKFCSGLFDGISQALNLDKALNAVKSTFKTISDGWKKSVAELGTYTTTDMQNSAKSNKGNPINGGVKAPSSYKPKNNGNVHSSNPALNGGKGGESAGMGSGNRSIAAGMGEKVNNFAYFSQRDARWKDKIYKLSNGGTTSTPSIGERGCGPTSMAMVATGLTGKTYYPTSLVDKAIKGGHSVNGGTAFSFFDKVGSDYGLSVEKGSGSPSVLKAMLKAGKPVIMSGTRTKYGRSESPYTAEGHLVVAVGMDGNNGVVINDPRGKEQSKVYDINKVSNETKATWGYKFTGDASNLPEPDSAESLKSDVSGDSGDDGGSMNLGPFGYIGKLGEIFSFGLGKLFGAEGDFSWGDESNSGSDTSTDTSGEYATSGKYGTDGVGALLDSKYHLSGIFEVGNQTPSSIANFDKLSGAISNNPTDRGGKSYGLPQFAINTGSIQGFVKWLSSNRPELYSPLSGKSVGSTAFDNAWKSAAGANMKQAQWDYANKEFFTPALASAKRKGVKYTDTVTIQSIINSQSKAKGPADSMFGDMMVYGAKGGNDIKAIINGIYDRGAEKVTSHYRGQPGNQKAWLTRYKKERSYALQMAERELSSKGKSSAMDAAGMGGDQPIVLSKDIDGKFKLPCNKPAGMGGETTTKSMRIESNPIGMSPKARTLTTQQNRAIKDVNITNKFALPTGDVVDAKILAEAILILREIATNTGNTTTSVDNLSQKDLEVIINNNIEIANAIANSGANMPVVVNNLVSGGNSYQNPMFNVNATSNTTDIKYTTAKQMAQGRKL